MKSLSGRGAAEKFMVVVLKIYGSRFFFPDWIPSPFLNLCHWDYHRATGGLPRLQY